LRAITVLTCKLGARRVSVAHRKQALRIMSDHRMPIAATIRPRFRAQRRGCLGAALLLLKAWAPEGPERDGDAGAYGHVEMNVCVTTAAGSLTILRVGCREGGFPWSVMRG
jgi:hypothetical protein